VNRVFITLAKECAAHTVRQGTAFTEPLRPNV
jgi:hypothetical protein